MLVCPPKWIAKKLNPINVTRDLTPANILIGEIKNRGDLTLRLPDIHIKCFFLFGVTLMMLVINMANTK